MYKCTEQSTIDSNLKAAQKYNMEHGLTESERIVLAMVSDRRSLPIDELTLHIEEVRRLISTRHLRLAVIPHEWGLEFNLEVGLESKLPDGEALTGCGSAEAPYCVERVNRRGLQPDSQIVGVYT